MKRKPEPSSEFQGFKKNTEKEVETSTESMGPPLLKDSENSEG